MNDLCSHTIHEFPLILLIEMYQLKRGQTEVQILPKRIIIIKIEKLKLSEKLLDDKLQVCSDIMGTATLRRFLSHITGFLVFACS